MNMGGVFSPIHIHFSRFLVIADAGDLPARLKAWDEGMTRSGIATLRSKKIYIVRVLHEG
jgi:hypothetical protein